MSGPGLVSMRGVIGGQGWWVLYISAALSSTQAPRPSGRGARRDVLFCYCYAIAIVLCYCYRAMLSLSCYAVLLDATCYAAHGGMLCHLELEHGGSLEDEFVKVVVVLLCERRASALVDALDDTHDLATLVLHRQADDRPRAVAG